MNPFYMKSVFYKITTSEVEKQIQKQYIGPLQSSLREGTFSPGWWGVYNLDFCGPDVIVWVYMYL